MFNLSNKNFYLILALFLAISLGAIALFTKQIAPIRLLINTGIWLSFGFLIGTAYSEVKK